MRKFAILLFVFAFALRLTAAWFWHDVPLYGDSSGDDDQFHTFASHVAEGKGYTNAHGVPTSFRAPGFPLFLAAIYVAIGPHMPTVFVVMCLLGAAACVLTYFLAREFVAENYARAAGILAAVYLPHVFFAATIISENLFVPLLTLGLWLFVRHLKMAQITPLFFSGVILGYAALTRPYALLLLPIFALILVAVHWRSFGTLVKTGLVYGVPFVALIMPWTLRNYHVHGHFVATTTNGGSTFYGGNNDFVLHVPKHWGYWVSTTELPGRDLIDAQPDEYSHDQMEWQLGKQWMRDHWLQMPVLWFLKLARLWWLPEVGGAHRLIRAVCYVPFFILIVAGFARIFRHREYWSASWCTSRDDVGDIGHCHDLLRHTALSRRESADPDDRRGRGFAAYS